MNAVKRIASVLLLISGLGLANEAARPIAVISSGKPVSVDGANMPPTGSASYPVVEQDEIVTQAPTLLTTNDHSNAILDADTRVKIDLLSPPGADPASQTAEKLFYIFLRRGGMTFDAKGGRMYVCANGRLVVPESHSKGTIRMNAAGAAILLLSAGSFAEQGKRGCSETGIAGFLSGVTGAGGAAVPVAGGAIAPIAGGAIAPIGGVGPGISIAATSAGVVGLGLGAAAGASSFVSSSSVNCATTGCNTVPATVSSSQP